MISIGFWYIPLALLVFGCLIFIHELGHFLTARLFGVTIKEFSIGMGPKLFSKTSEKSGTAYSVRLLPIGGYVSMEGEDEASEDANAFGNKAAWKRLIITVAGAVMNILLGILLMFILVFSTKSLASNTIAEFKENSVSSSSLMVGDRVVKVENIPVNTGNELVYEIMHKGAKPLDLTVIRDGEKILLEDVTFGSETEAGYDFGTVDFYVYSENPTFVNLLKHAFFRSLSTVKMIWDSVIDLVSGKYGIEAVSGPVGATTAIGDAAAAGGTNFFYIVVVITMNLGVMNLLPFPALDGGRLIFLLIELVLRKRVKPEIEGYINFAGLIILFALMILITFKDIMGLI